LQQNPDGFEWFARDWTNLPAGWPYPAKISSFEWRARAKTTPLMEIEVSGSDLPWDRLTVLPDGTPSSWNEPDIPDLGRSGYPKALNSIAGRAMRNSEQDAAPA